MQHGRHRAVRDLYQITMVAGHVAAGRHVGATATFEVFVRRRRLGGAPFASETTVRAAFFSFLGYFLTPSGLVVLGILDASMVFFLPLGIDFVAILMAARKPHLFLLYAVLATLGSVLGAAGTYWLGRKIGEKGLSRFVKERQLRRVKHRLDRGVFVVAALALIPPPFPFTPFVLGAGALGVNAWSFFTGLAAMRLLRFGVEAALARHYGSQIIRWMKTPTFEAIVGGFIALAAIGTVVSAVLVWRSARSDSGGSPRPLRTERAATDLR